MKILIKVFLNFHSIEKNKEIDSNDEILKLLKIYKASENKAKKEKKGIWIESTNEIQIESIIMKIYHKLFK